MIILDKLSKPNPRCRHALYLRPANMHADPMIPLLMTGKGSSSCPVIFYWKEITPCRGCSSVFNGLIALEKAASGNAVIGGNIAWRRYRQQEKVKELA